METKEKPLGSWQCVCSLLGAGIRLRKIEKAVQRSIDSLLEDPPARAAWNETLSDSISNLVETIEDLRWIAADKYVTERDEREKGKHAGKRAGK